MNKFTKFETKEGVVDFLILSWNKMKSVIEIYLIANAIITTLFSILINLKFKNSYIFEFYIVLFYFIFLLLLSTFISVAIMFHFYGYYRLILFYPLKFFKKQAKVNFILQFILFVSFVLYLFYYTATFQGSIKDLMISLTDLLSFLGIIFITGSSGLIFLNIVMISKLTLNKELRNSFIFLFLVELTLFIDIYLSINGLLTKNLALLLSSLLSNLLVIYPLLHTSTHYIKALKELKE
ncbi:MAG: hypothetical protein ABGW69_03525 [Nanoarchaeota archaeon]